LIRFGAVDMLRRNKGHAPRALGSSPMVLNGYYIEDLEEGMTAAFGKTITDADILMFAGVSGDTNPVHLNEEFAAGTAFNGRIAHGMLTASLISTVLGTKLPGPGCIYLSQTLKFLAPVRAGDTVRAEVLLKSLDRERRRCVFETSCKVGGKNVLEGAALGAESTTPGPGRRDSRAAGAGAAARAGSTSSVTAVATPTAPNTPAAVAMSA
jgi:3-hydroxybutyryl-CoA dehydratase